MPVSALEVFTCKEEIPECIDIDDMKINANESVKPLGILIDDKYIDMFYKHCSKTDQHVV